jgi:hypothetical protein
MPPSTIPSVIPNSRLEKFFARVKATTRGRIILAIDATASREPCWDAAAQLTAQMFDAVAAIGGLDVQLVYYRGADECAASPWTNDARKLVKLMSSVMCRSGHTQIGKVLTHAAKEHRQHSVNAVIFIGDACEESPEALRGKLADLMPASRDRDRGMPPVFVFQEGDDARAAAIFAELARITGGAVASFDANAAQRLADLLKAAATFAAGGMAALALAAQKSEAATLLLGQLKLTEKNDGRI